MTDTGTVATPTGGTGPVPVTVSGEGPRLTPSPLLALLYLNVPFDEKAWPRIEYGDAPFRDENLETPWVEAHDTDEPITIDALLEEAERRWKEINSESTVEESEELQINAVFAPELGSIVRNVSFSFGEGGREPVVRISGTMLASRKNPLLRVASALANLAVKEKSKPV